MNTDTVQLTPDMTVDIDTLPAGPEMNALVAVEVMEMIMRDVEIDTPTCWQKPNNGKWYKLPEFSTSISAAWEVVEELRERKAADGLCHWYFTLIDRASDPAWLVNFIFRGDRYIEFQGTGSTPPLAICRAALKAKL